MFLALLRIVRSLRHLGTGEPEALVAAWKDRGLAPRHFGTLIELAVGGPMTIGQLAGRLGVALSTASLLVNQLAAAGLISRTEDVADHRRTIVEVPTEAAAGVNELLSRYLVPLDEALATLSPAEQEATAAAFRLLAARLTGAAAAAPERNCAAKKAGTR